MRQVKYTLAALLALVLLNSSCKKERENKTVEHNVKIGALLSLTGNWSSLGITSKAAIDIALEEINASMSKNGSGYRFSSVVYDTKLDATLASQYIATAKGEGCQFILGPQSSAEAGAVLNYANANNILVVSQGSTAGSLSIDYDNLYRFCPADDVEGVAMGKTIYNDGIRALVTAARDDAGNKGLQLSVGKAFNTLNGMVSATTPYSNSANVDFTALLADIKARIVQYQSTYATNQIAVYLASFDECVELFQMATADPVLSSVRWYGGDGTALSAALIGNTTAAEFAIATKYFAPAFGLPEYTAGKWQPLSAEIKARTGIAPDAFALAAYDALWVLATTYMNFPYAQPEFSQLKSNFTMHAAEYHGATGSTRLNSAGDRATGSYDYWGIAKEGNSYKWIVVGQSE
jgi:branched-chain amino acid transport system substrate-binding protein